MDRRLDWTVEKIIQSAGIPLEDADDYIVALAEKCKEQCYYIDRAAQALINTLRGHR